MICTVKLFSKDTTKFNQDYLEKEYGQLEVMTCGKEYYKYYTQIKNFTLSYDVHGLHLEGSAPKFLHGNNINTLKFQEVSGFIGELSEAVGFDVSDMTITRIDITDNLVMQETPRAYKRYLGSCNYFQRTDYDRNGLNYVNQNRNLLFYDKLLEVKNKGGAIPADLVGKNLLRYEYSIRKRLSRHLGESIRTLPDLQRPDNFRMLVNKWEGAFNKIKKVSYQSSVMMPYKPGMKLKDWFCLRGVQLHGGLDNAINDINEYEALGTITARQSRHMKDKLVQWQNRYNELENERGDLSAELIQKLAKKAEENRRMV